MTDEPVPPEAPAEPAVPDEAPKPLTFMERARIAAGQAASTAARVGVDVGTQAAKAGVDLGGKAAKAAGDAGEKAVTTIRDPATKVRAQSALKKAKRGFTTALERIDPRILADVVVKATSLQERANLSLKDRGSVYRIGEISIGASIPPSIHFAIVRVEDPDNVLADSQTLLESASAATIVSLDGTAVEGNELEELEDED